MKIYLIMLLLWIPTICFSQNRITIKGKVVDVNDEAIPSAIITLGTKKTATNNQGQFALIAPNKLLELTIKATGFKTKTIKIHGNHYRQKKLKITLDYIINEVTIESTFDKEISTLRFSPAKIERMPSAFNDFNDILSTFGARSNSELSSSYAVRGGNYNENLIYVNGIQVYRPFLVRSGQQEGLSFVNPNLVENVEFSMGGWKAAYGDKLSSVLNIDYKKPRKSKGSINLGLLQSAVHVEGYKKKLSYVVGVRRKSAQYILNSLQTKGDYLPQFLDLQSYLHYSIDKKTSVGLLASLSTNRYFLKPSDRETKFGTLDKTLRLFIEYQGREELKYRTWQNGVKLSHVFNDNFLSNLVVSYMNTREREHSEIEGQYQLSEIMNVGLEDNLDNSLINIGNGTQYTHRRNSLDANVFALENRSELLLGKKNQVGLGFRYSRERFEDVLGEYAFIDSAQFVTFTNQYKASNTILTNRFSAYIQDQFDIDSTQSLSFGARVGYWNLNKEWLLSPTLQYAMRPKWKKKFVFKAAIGLYQQPPFYRELRSFEGELNESLRSQKAMHYILGVDHAFKWGDRLYRWISEAYYKDMWDVIPYDVDDVRLRYYAHNEAKAYVWGFDTRIHGEFIKGTESWMSLSILKTKEDVFGDGLSYIRRPTDQRAQLGLYFEDHLPNNPTWRMNLKLIWGTQLPFGLPNNSKLRSAFKGESYRRVDIGFSKLINEIYLPNGSRLLKSLWIGVDILNLLSIRNVISHSWINDVNGNQYAIPNALTSRLINLRIIGKF